MYSSPRMNSGEIPACKSPARMQKHLENLPPVPFNEQLIKSSDWITQTMCYDEKILLIGHDVPAKLQDGPQCGIVSLWMAGQHLDPNNSTDVGTIQELAVELQFTKHGEMFSAKNMATLAEKIYSCDAEKVKESGSYLTTLETLLDLICIQEKLILVPYDSDADQWPCLKQGTKAHWGLIFGLALILPTKNKVLKAAQYLDGFTSHLKPPMSESGKKAILDDISEIKYLLMLRQSKSKRIFLFNPKLLAESNQNLTGYSNNHRHHELFRHEGFVMPKGGVKAGLKGQLVVLGKKATQTKTTEEGEAADAQT